MRAARTPRVDQWSAKIPRARSCWPGMESPSRRSRAALALAGYRVTNRMGHHRAAVDASRHLLGEHALMSRIGSLRRMRDRGMYEMDLPDVDEIAEALDDCEQLIELVARAVQRASTC